MHRIRCILTSQRFSSARIDSAVPGVKGGLVPPWLLHHDLQLLPPQKIDNLKKALESMATGGIRNRARLRVFTDIAGYDYPIITALLKSAVSTYPGYQNIQNCDELIAAISTRSNAGLHSDSRSTEIILQDLLDVYCSNKNTLNRAHDIFRLILRTKSKSGSFRAFKTLARAYQYHFNNLKSIESAFLQLGNSHPPNLDTYILMMDIYSDLADLEQVVLAFKALLLNGLQPTHRVLEILVSAYLKKHHRELALKCMRDFDYYYNICAEEDLWHAIIYQNTMLSTESGMLEACRIFEIAQLSPNAIISWKLFKCIANGWAAIGNKHQFNEFEKLAKAHGHDFSVIPSYCEVEIPTLLVKQQSVVKLLENVNISGQELSTVIWNIVSVHLPEKKVFNELNFKSDADALFQAFISNNLYLNSTMFSKIMEEMIIRDMPWNTFVRIYEMVLYNKIFPNDLVFEHLLKACVKNKKLAEMESVIETFERMETPLSDESYNRIIAILVESPPYWKSNTFAAIRILSLMLRWKQNPDIKSVAIILDAAKDFWASPAPAHLMNVLLKTDTNRFDAILVELCDFVISQNMYYSQMIFSSLNDPKSRMYILFVKVIRRMSTQGRAKEIEELFIMLLSKNTSLHDELICLGVEQLGVVLKAESSTRALWHKIIRHPSNSFSISESLAWAYTRSLVWWGRPDEAVEFATEGLLRIGAQPNQKSIISLARWLESHGYASLASQCRDFWRTRGII